MGLANVSSGSGNAPAGVAGWVGAAVLLLVLVLGWYGLRRLKAWYGGLLGRATRPIGDLLPGSDEPAIASSRPTAGLAAIRAHDPLLDENDLLAGIEAQLTRLITAASEGRLDEVRLVVSDDLFTRFGRRIGALGSGGGRSMASSVTFAGVRIVGAHSDARWDTVTVRAGVVTELLRARDKGGQVKRRAVPRLLDMVFQRASTVSTPVAGLLSSRCPGCQAALQLDASGACSFCRRPVMSGAFDWVLVRQEQPGFGVGPRPAPDELAAVAAAAGRDRPIHTVNDLRRSAFSADALLLGDREAVATNSAGRMTAKQKHTVVARARKPITESLGAAVQLAPIVIVAVVVLRVATRQAKDPLLHPVTVGGQTRTLPLLLLGALGVLALVGLIILGHVLRALRAVPAWRRARGPLATEDGEVVFRDGWYRIRSGGRDLASWSDGSSTGFAGVAPGSVRIHRIPLGEVLSVESTADEAARVAALSAALRSAAIPSPTEGVRTEGWVTALGTGDRPTLQVGSRVVAADVAVARVVVPGVWYAYELDGAGTRLLALEPRMAEHATSLAVDRAATTGGLEDIRAHDPGFDPDLVKRQLERMFLRVQEAWCRLDARVSRGVMSDAAWSVHSRLIADRIAHGLRPVQEGRRVESIDIVGAERTAQWATLLTRITWSVAEGEARTVDNAIVSAPPHTARERCEEWVLRRAANATTPPGGGVLAERCPNCQASIDVDDLGVCTYCRVAVSGGALDWVVTRVERLAVTDAPASLVAARSRDT